MTEKRYYLKDRYYIFDSENKLGNMEQLLSYSEVVDRLNELHEENKQFKKALRVAYNETKLTKQTKHTIETIAELTGVDLE